jgi:hypothetical protein
VINSNQVDHGLEGSKKTVSLYAMRHTPQGVQSNLKLLNPLQAAVARNPPK